MSVRYFLYKKREELKRSIFRSLNGYCGVLLYHRVIEQAYDPQQLCVSPDNFYEQLSQLKRKGNFLSMDEFCYIMSVKKKFPRNSFVITFDDGYVDNYLNALPILETLGLQAVFYISTGNLDTNHLFWWDTLDLVYKNKTENDKELQVLAQERGFGGSEELYSYYLQQCKTAELANRESMVKEFSGNTQIEAHEKNKYRCLSGKELQQLAASKSAVIGAHTVNHLSLAHQPGNIQHTEINDSVQELARRLGKPVEHFSFPYGEKSHFNPTTISICRELNLKSAAANYYDYAKNNDDIMAFPRLVVRNDNYKTLNEKLKMALG